MHVHRIATREDTAVIRRSPSVGGMLGQGLRRWPNILPTLGERLPGHSRPSLTLGVASSTVHLHACSRQSQQTSRCSLYSSNRGLRLQARWLAGCRGQPADERLYWPHTAMTTAHTAAKTRKAKAYTRAFLQCRGGDDKDTGVLGGC